MLTVAAPGSGVGASDGPRRCSAPGSSLVLACGLIPVPAPNGPVLDVAILQGNDIEHRLADPLVEDVRIARNFERLQRALAADPPDLSVWPEDAIDIDPTRYEPFGRAGGGFDQGGGEPRARRCHHRRPRRSPVQRGPAVRRQGPACRPVPEGPPGAVRGVRAVAVRGRLDLCAASDPPGPDARRRPAHDHVPARRCGLLAASPGSSSPMSSASRTRSRRSTGAWWRRGPGSSWSRPTTPRTSARRPRGST